jgi:hypothetical protein
LGTFNLSRGVYGLLEPFAPFSPETSMRGTPLALLCRSGKKPKNKKPEKKLPRKSSEKKSEKKLRKKNLLENARLPGGRIRL